MNNLSKNEWVAVVVSLFVVGFFFLFGQTIISLFNGTANNQNNTVQANQLEKQDLLIGGGQIAGAGDRITVHYTGTFTDGTVFDSSVTRGEPFQFVLGAGQVIRGWDEGIEGMREGGKRLLSIPPELGYGLNDYGPIKGGSTLIFEIELIKVEK